MKDCKINIVKAVNAMEKEKYNFYKQLPKIELHAHLNGSLGAGTLLKLGCSKEDILHYQKLTKYLHRSEKQLQECFKLFKIAHNATCTQQAVYEATKLVIEEFYEDNVVYLELRTTPKDENDMTKCEYIDSVIKGIEDSNKNITTKLLLSIDRGHDVQASEESMKLIIYMKQKYPHIIKGVDLSGNPISGSFNSNLFRQARENGLFVTTHCAEIKNATEVEEMLKFGPDRIGHGTFLHPKYGGSQECWTLYSRKPIPLECCLTSNILCGTVEGYKNHHLQEWIKNCLPYSLCTDDKGVFCTSVSQELKLAAEHFNLSYEDLWNINFQAVDYSFASNAEKNNLKGMLEEWKLKNSF